jgi:hypothetical protein
MELVQDCVHWWISGSNGAEFSGSNTCGLETEIVNIEGCG